MTKLIFSLHDAGEPIDFHSVHARLAGEWQERFAAIVLDARASTIEDGLACIEKLRRENLDSIRRDLKAKIREAEREGRMSDALALMKKLSELG